MFQFIFDHYSVWKSLHIIFVVSWFAGLFYIVRLFIYHTEASSKSEIEFSILNQQFRIMEKRLWQVITMPAMILTLLFGTLMLIANTALLHQSWMHLKLTFVAFLLVYHFICLKIMKQMNNGIFKWKSTHLRIWNEVATLLLVAIVFLITMRSNLGWLGGIIGFFSVGILLILGIKLYKKFRKE